MRSWWRDPLLYMSIFIILIVGCVAGSNWKSVPEGDFQYQSFQYQGHAYLRFSFGNHDTPVVHDPDCTKCIKEKLQGVVPLESVP
jgi:hypothetical protein